MGLNAVESAGIWLECNGLGLRLGAGTSSTLRPMARGAGSVPRGAGFGAGLLLWRSMDSGGIWLCWLSGTCCLWGGGNPMAAGALAAPGPLSGRLLRVDR